MSAGEEAASKWLWAFLSPFSDNPPPPQTDQDWAEVFKAADNGLVLPRLAFAVGRDLPSAPQPVRDYLDVVIEMSRLRNEQLREQLVTLIAHLNARGVVPIIIKGATSLLDESVDIGARSMLDMDVWTPEPRDQTIAMQALVELGYAMRAPMDLYEKGQHFPPFFKDDALARIELHRSMVHPRYAPLVNEAMAATSATERQFAGATYRVLDPSFAIALSYLQCRWSCEGRTFTIMKWLDLLDRCNAMGLTRVTSCADLGVQETGEAIDRQFLTTLSIMSGLPYEGPRDDSFYKAWMRRNATPAALRLCSTLAWEALDSRRWSGKDPRAIWRAAIERIRQLPERYRQSKRLDRF